MRHMLNITWICLFALFAIPKAYGEDEKKGKRTSQITSNSLGIILGYDFTQKEKIGIEASHRFESDMIWIASLDYGSFEINEKKFSKEITFRANESFAVNLDTNFYYCNFVLLCAGGGAGIRYTFSKLQASLKNSSSTKFTAKNSIIGFQTNFSLFSPWSLGSLQANMHWIYVQIPLYGHYFSNTEHANAIGQSIKSFEEKSSKIARQSGLTIQGSIRFSIGLSF